MTREMTVEEETEVIDMLNAAIKFSEGVTLYNVEGALCMEVQTKGGNYVLNGDCLFTVLKQYHIRRTNHALCGD